MNDRLQRVFPGLHSTPFRITSDSDDKYNCIAWGADDKNNWWWPVGTTRPIFWPPGVLREVTLEAFIAAFATQGYVDGADDSLESGFEKIALFVNAVGAPTHGARQLASGLWTSKLGMSVDIEHSLHALEGEFYGTVATILKRRKGGSADGK